MKVTSWENPVNGAPALRVEFADPGQRAAFEAAASGACYIRGDGRGGVVKAPRYPEPAVEPDPVLAAPWPVPVPAQMTFVPNDETPARHHDAGTPVYVQHLCGYGYTPENYGRAAAWMESAGFECLRSRRGETGKYWELWYLPGPWRARGPIAGFTDPHAIARAVAENARPGAVTLGAPGGWFQTID